MQSKLLENAVKITRKVDEIYCKEWYKFKKKCLKLLNKMIKIYYKGKNY